MDLLETEWCGTSELRNNFSNGCNARSAADITYAPVLIEGWSIADGVTVRQDSPESVTSVRAPRHSYDVLACGILVHFAGEVNVSSEELVSFCQIVLSETSPHVCLVESLCEGVSPCMSIARVRGLTLVNSGDKA